MFSLFLHEIDQLTANWNAGDKNHIPVAKFYVPGSWMSWLVTELNPDDLIKCVALFDAGSGNIGYGLFSFDDIARLSKAFKVDVCRDDSFKGKYPISTYMTAALTYGFITQQEVLLAPFTPPEKPDSPAPPLVLV